MISAIITYDLGEYHRSSRGILRVHPRRLRLLISAIITYDLGEYLRSSRGILRVYPRRVRLCGPRVTSGVRTAVHPTGAKLLCNY